MRVATLGRAPLTYRPSSLGNFHCQVLSPPCGQATASQADELITRRLKESLALLDTGTLRTHERCEEFVGFPSHIARQRAKLSPAGGLAQLFTSALTVKRQRQRFCCDRSCGAVLRSGHADDEHNYSRGSSYEVS